MTTQLPRYVDDVDRRRRRGRRRAGSIDIVADRRTSSTPTVEQRPHERFTNEVMAGGSVTEKRRRRAGRRSARRARRDRRRRRCSACSAVFNIWWFVFVVGVLISIFLHETRPLHDRPLDGHEGHPVLHRVRAAAVELPPGRDRVRRAGAPARRLRPHHRHEQHGRGAGRPTKPRTYRQQSYPRRLLVITAGSIMHMLIAIVLLFTVYVDRRRGQVDRRRRGAELVARAARRPGRRPASVPTTSSSSIDGAAARRAPTSSARPCSAGRPGDTRRSSSSCATVIDVDVPVDARRQHRSGVAAVRQALRRRRQHRGVRDGRSLGRRRRRQQRDRHLPDGVGDRSKGVVKVLNPVNIFTHLTGTNDDLATRPTTLVGVTRTQRRRRRRGRVRSGSCSCSPCSTCSSACSTCSRCCRSTAGTPRSPPTSGSASATASATTPTSSKMMPFAMAVMTVLMFLFVAGSLPRHHRPRRLTGGTMQVADWTTERRKTRQISRRPGRRRWRRADHGAVDDDHQDGRRRGHAAADLRAGGGRLRHRPLHVQRAGGRRGARPDRAALADPGHRRHPPPVPDGAGGDARPVCTACGSTPATSAGPSTSRPSPARPAIAACRSASVSTPGRSIPTLYEKHGGPTPEAMVESALQEIAYFDEVDFDLDQDLGQGVERAADGRGLPPAVSEVTDLPLHLGVTEAGPPPAGLVKAHRRHRDAADGGHRRHDPLLAHGRPGRGGAGRPPAARGARPARAQERRPHRLPVVRARRGRRDRRRQAGDGGVRRAAVAAPGGGDGLRRQRSGRGTRGRPRDRRRQQARPPVRQGSQHRRRARERDGRGARRVGRVHQRARHRGGDRPGRHRAGRARGGQGPLRCCSTPRATTPTTPTRGSSRSARPCPADPGSSSGGQRM